MSGSPTLLRNLRQCQGVADNLLNAPAGLFIDRTQDFLELLRQSRHLHQKDSGGSGDGQADASERPSGM